MRKMWGAKNPNNNPNNPNNRRRDNRQRNNAMSYSFYPEDAGYYMQQIPGHMPQMSGHMPQNPGPSYQQQQQRYYQRPPPQAPHVAHPHPQPSSSSGPTAQKLYICPCCNEPYDLHYTNNHYKGKVPLILTCQHTVCQECIQKKLVKGSIVCPTCQNQCELPKSQENIQQVFTPNYYLCGFIFFHKKQLRSVNNIDSIGLVSARGPKEKSVQGEQQSVEKCCFVSCDKEAVMDCPECNDIYCTECCTVVHKSAKSLMFHKPVLMNRSGFSVELEKCPEHPKMFVEFFCESCDQNACCYCMLDKHQGHNIVYLWKLEPEEMSECELLKKKAEKIFKQLLITQKQVKKLTNYSTTTVARKIRDFFVFAHAVLLKSEKNLTVELDSIATENHGLAAISASLTKSINTVKNILCTDLESEKKINRKGLLKQLRELSVMPRFLLNENGTAALEPVRFISNCDADLSKVDLQFYIEKSEESEFILATEDQLPLNYVPDASLDDSDIDSIVDSLLTKTNKRKSRGSVKSDAGGGSLKSVKLLTRTESDVAEAAQRSSRLRPVPATNNDIERIVVTHIKSMDSFYIQYKKMQNKLFMLAREIEDYVKMGGQAVKSPQIGELYLVRYNAKTEQMWCRGRVTEIINGESEPLYEVFFIDYGHTQTVNLDRLKEIPPFLCQKKAFAVECQLYNPAYVSWSKNAHISLGKFVSGKDVGMWVKSSSQGILVVDLMVSSSSGSPTSVIDLLIHATDNVLAKDGPSSVESASCIPRVIIHAPDKPLEKNQKENIIIVNVLDPYCVFVHLVSYRELFLKMTAAMKKAYKNTTFDQVVPVEGTFVVVEDRNAIRGRWHRALVKSVDYDLDKIYALLVDWGINITVPMSSVRKLTSNFAKLDTQAIPIKMADIAPFDKSPSWSSSSIQCLEAYKNSQEVLKMVITSTEPDLEAIFFDIRGNNNICLNAQMVEHNLADSIGSLSKTVIWPHYGLKVPVYTEDDGFVAGLLKKVDDENSSESESDEGETPGSKKRQVEILKVIDPDTIVVKFTEYKDKEADLHKYLQICYTEGKQTKSTPWNIDEMCVIAYNDRYVRGKIVEKLENDMYKVYLPDIVEEAVVKADEIYVYNEMFTKYRQIAVKCQLAHIRPAGDTGRWVTSAVEALQELFQKYRLIYVTKAEDNDNDKKAHFPVNMWYTKVKPGGALEPDRKKYISVNNALVKLGFAYKKPSPKKPETPETKKTNEPMKKQPENEVHAKSTEKPDGFVNKPEDLAAVDPEKNDDQVPVKNKVSPKKGKGAKGKKKLANAEEGVALEKVEAELVEMMASKPCENVKETESDESKKGEGDSKKSETVSESDSSESNLMKKDVEVEEKAGGDGLQLKVPDDWNELIEEEFSQEEVEGQSTEEKASPYHKARTEISEWLPPFRIVKHEFQAWITCVETGGFLFLHDDCIEKVYRLLEKNLKDYFDENMPEQRESLEWKPGYLCTIHYNEFWYRGKVLDVISSKEIKVFMIDYGSDHVVTPDCLYREILHPDVQAFATKVKLDGVYPKSGKWLSSDYDTLLELTPEYARVVVKGPLEVEIPLVDIYDEHDVLLNQKLCEICPNLIRYSVVPPKSHDDDDVIIENEEIIPAQLYLNYYKEFEKQPVFTTLLKFVQPRLPEAFVKQRTIMSIINVLQYDEVLLKSPLQKDVSEDMYNMTIDIQESAFELPTVEDIKVGTPCVAPWSQDGVWYRAVVHEIDETASNYVTVLFVDYGNIDTVVRSDVKMLKENWFEVPLDCYTARLNIELLEEDKKEEVFEAMSNLLNKNRFVQVIAEDPSLVIDLYDNAGDLCYKSLISDGLLRQTVSSSSN